MGMKIKKKVGQRPQKLDANKEAAACIDIRVGYATAALTTLSCLLGFLFWMRKQNEASEVKHTK